MYFIHVYVTLNWRTGHIHPVWTIRNIQLEQYGVKAMLSGEILFGKLAA
jgi:hypothetical protein